MFMCLCEYLKQKMNMRPNYMCSRRKNGATPTKFISLIFLPIPHSSFISLLPKCNTNTIQCFSVGRNVVAHSKFLKPKSNQYTMSGMLFLKKIVFVLLKGRRMSIQKKKNSLALEATTFISLQDKNSKFKGNFQRMINLSLFHRHYIWLY